MNGAIRWLLLIGCVIIILFGVATLHFNFGPDEHHIQWAQQRNLPQPSKGLFAFGALVTIAGSLAMGFLLGRGKRQ